MRVLGYYHLDGFYIRALEGPPELTVVYRDKDVLDADLAAQRRGVHSGMPLAEAKAILAGEGKFVAWEEENFRAAQRAWIDVATEYSDAVEPDGQHAAYVDLSGHPNPRQIAYALRNRLTAMNANEKAGPHQNLKVRIGVAGSRWVAREAALRGDPAEIATLLPRRYVAPLPTFSLPSPAEVVQRLVLLGYRTVGDVAELPFETLQAQFGELAFDLKRTALGGGDAHVEAVFPAGSLAERFCFDGSPDTIQELEAGLRKVAARLGNALRRDEASAKQVELFLEGADGNPEVRRRTFAKPVTGTAVLLGALRLMLADFPREQIASLRVRLPDVERSRRVQLGLDGERSRRDRVQSVEAAIANARVAFGDTAVRLAGELPEARWRKVRRAYSAANGWIWK